MPKIIGQAEQQRAMREIRSGLKELESINKFLAATSANGEFVVTMTMAGDTKMSATAFCESKEDIDLLVMNQREHLVDMINDLAQRNRIEFDEQDMMILENEPSDANEILSNLGLDEDEDTDASGDAEGSNEPAGEV